MGFARLYLRSESVRRKKNESKCKGQQNINSLCSSPLRLLCVNLSLGSFNDVACHSSVIRFCLPCVCHSIVAEKHEDIGQLFSSLTEKKTDKNLIKCSKLLPQIEELSCLLRAPNQLLFFCLICFCRYLLSLEQ